MRYIRVRGTRVGLWGMEEVYRTLATERLSKEALRAALLQHAARHNYIPAGLEEDYASALLEDFEEYRQSLS